MLQSNVFPEKETESTPAVQLHGRYICKQVKSGMMLIDQKRAHERIIYDNLIDSFTNKKHRASQQLLFPIQQEFQPGDFTLLGSLASELHELGFDMNEFGPNTMAIYGIPAALGEADPSSLLEELLEQFRMDEQSLDLKLHEKMAMSLARYSARFAVKSMSPEKLIATIEKLFSSSNPNYTPGGKSIVQLITMEEIQQKFNSNSRL
jgi:DNA mismatch repair protein MutL